MPGPCEAQCNTCGLDWPRYVLPPHGCGICGHANCAEAKRWRE